MPVQILSRRLAFPDPRTADERGLVAVGGDFSAARLRLAYRSGIFPWTADPITWWSPDPRAVLEFDEIHISHSLSKVLRHGTFDITRDKAFVEVINGCAAPGRGRTRTWISKEFIEGYSRLHQEGLAHSVECWHEGQLAGGIYGVAIAGLFAGESMFHRASDASKVALVSLVNHLRNRGFELLDIQELTPITTRMGGKNIPRDEYLKRLARALEKQCSFD